jgi:hypothetical protein
MWKFLSLLEVVGKVGRCEVGRGIHISWLLHIHNSISCAHKLITHSLTNQAQFNILLLSTPRFRCQLSPSSFPITMYTCYVSSESYFPIFNRPRHVWWRVQTTTIPNTKFSPISYFSLLLGPKYIPHHRLFFPLTQKPADGPHHVAAVSVGSQWRCDCSLVLIIRRFPSGAAEGATMCCWVNRSRRFEGIKINSKLNDLMFSHIYRVGAGNDLQL